MFTLDIIDTRIFHKKFSNSLLKLPKVTVTAKSENVVTKFARPFDMTIWSSQCFANVENIFESVRVKSQKSQGYDSFRNIRDHL